MSAQPASPRDEFAAADGTALAEGSCEAMDWTVPLKMPWLGRYSQAGGLIQMA